MKNCTTLEQSKVLAKILPIESADMTYLAITRGGTTIYDWEISIGLNPAITQNLFSYRNGYVVPAWSLNALLEYLKQRYYVRLSHDGVSWGITCFEHDTKKEYNLYMFEEPVDACWGMILRLNKEE